MIGVFGGYNGVLTPTPFLGILQVVTQTLKTLKTLKSLAPAVAVAQKDTNQTAAADGSKAQRFSMFCL